MYNYSVMDESKVEFIEIGPTTDLPIGERLFVEIEGKPIVVFNYGGQFFSIADVVLMMMDLWGEGSLEDSLSRVPGTEPSLIFAQEK